METHKDLILSVIGHNHVHEEGCINLYNKWIRKNVVVHSASLIILSHTKGLTQSRHKTSLTGKRWCFYFGATIVRTVILCRLKLQRQFFNKEEETE